MTASAKRVLQEALELIPEERADLAARLLASLESRQESGVAEAWEAEIAKRIEDLDSGRVKAISMSEFWVRVGGRADAGESVAGSPRRRKRVARSASVVPATKLDRRRALRK